MKQKAFFKDYHLYGKMKNSTSFKKDLKFIHCALWKMWFNNIPKTTY